jgi:hypothetical protein
MSIYANGQCRCRLVEAMFVIIHTTSNVLRRVLALFASTMILDMLQ